MYVILIPISLLHFILYFIPSCFQFYILIFCILFRILTNLIAPKAVEVHQGVLEKQIQVIFPDEDIFHIKYSSVYFYTFLLYLFIF